MPIDKSSTILTIILAFIFLGEPITLVKGIAVVLIGIGTFMMIQKKETVDEPKEAQGRFLVDLCIAFYSVCQPDRYPWKSRHRRCGVKPLNCHQNLRCPGDGMGGCICQRQTAYNPGNSENELGFICLSGLATGGSWLCYYRAPHDGMASVVVPIDKLSILVSIAFSYIVFRERLTKKAVVGLCLNVAGTLIMLL